MDRRGNAALLTLFLFFGCLDPAGDRTERDFSEVGRADLGALELYLDPGTVLEMDREAMAVTLRSNAPVYSLKVTSTATTARALHVTITNTAPGTRIEPAQPLVVINDTTIAFTTTIPPETTLTFSFQWAGADREAPFRFAWVGDVQSGLEDFSEVRAAINRDPTLEFVIFGGDLTADGTRTQLLDFIQAANELRVPWYAIIGNHDTIGAAEDLFQERIGRLNYAFDYRGARFILIDSASATLNQLQYDFLDGVLDPTGPTVRLVAIHIPPLDYAGLRDGGFASRYEGAKVYSILGAGGVDLILSGHLHTLHYTTFADVEQIVSGDGGVDIPQRLDSIGSHYLAIRIDPVLKLVEAAPVIIEP